MQDADRAVVSGIAEAWAGADYPGDTRLAGKDDCCGEYGYVAAFFRGRHWRDVTVESLRGYEGPANACLSFMSAEALRFYLPAFMFIALDEPPEGPRSDWEASFVDVAVWALLPPRYRPEVHEIERSVPGNANVTSPESMARPRRWWDNRMAGLSAAQRRAIVAFLERLHQRGASDDVAEALDFWRNGAAFHPAG